ncbi:ArgP/LysG family DNA-binding transcriptional regulator [Enterobacter sp. RHBSTW-00994]|uniref:ArgP/LysG family DNA-binding transcriptional regulator n=1 Tax=Enterobacter sp. RHBSTW-00994 TaxID=2742676 RepID=UPI0015E8FDBE|nr:ArgP/LysG family DNA-binding transcriptional regulator [Enterobacter sp. RHBSTW-00994]QLR43251.1 ArgP/LysG family DNA-binding transcriptional regulator [Enterobacter sp. RHBSTW-00994]
MKLNYSFLETFMAIIRSGSFELASRKLHITPSAVSQRIRVLEEEVGQVLIIRGSPCQPSQAGMELYQYAEKIELLEKDFFAVQEKKYQGKAVVAVNADSVDGWFLSAINTAFREQNIVFDVRIEDQDYSATLLQKGEVMAAVSADPTLVQGCKVEYLGTMRYKAYASVDYYAEYFRDGISEKTLKNAPVIMFNHKDDLQNKFIRKVISCDIEPPSQYIPSTSAYLHAVLRGLGWGMLPEHLSEPFRDKGILVEIAEGNPVDTRLYWHRWSLKLTLLERLSECVHVAAREALRE